MKKELRALLDRYLESDAYTFQDLENIDINSIGREGDTFLHLTTRDGDVNGIKLLIECGANVDQIDDVGITPLHIAAQYCSPTIVSVLLQAGADARIVNEFGSTPMSIATEGLLSNDAAKRKCSLEIIEILNKFLLPDVKHS